MIYKWFIDGSVFEYEADEVDIYCCSMVGAYSHYTEKITSYECAYQLAVL